MQIIAEDNFNRDHISDVVHAINVPAHEAEAVVKDLNSRSGPHASRFYVVKPDDYIPFKWEP